MPKITLILHNIRSTHNVGSMFRTAEGFGLSEIIISGYTPYPEIVSGNFRTPGNSRDPRLPHIAEKLTAQIHKTALGAEKLVPFRVVTDLEEYLDALDVPLIALEQSPGSTPLSKFSAPAACALLLGEEVRGITPELLARCDQVVEIPMLGQKESFNVSVAAGIALYELTRAG